MKFELTLLFVVIVCMQSNNRRLRRRWCIDQIAIPEFSSGAMENWGLVTYREVNLLYNEAVSSPADKQRVASVIAHELAHMVRLGLHITRTY